MENFIETKYDKFVFRVMKAGFLYNQQDFWASVQGNVATIGISDFLQKANGDVAFLETIEAGASVKQGDELGKIETIKTTFGITSPVSGKVVEVNEELDSSPFLLNEDPYGKGWIYKIELTSHADDARNLLSPEAYFELMKEKIAEEMKKQ